MSIQDERIARGTTWLSLRNGAVIDPRGGPVDPGGPPSGAFSTWLSLDELAMQQARRVSGPFRISGDFSTNSPGHWTEMNSAMGLSPFQSARWQGPTSLTSSGAVAVGGLTNDPPGNIRAMAHDMMSAAYAAANVGNTAVAQAIVAEIQYQATRTNLNYGNRTLWPFNYYNDINPMFMHCVWVKDYMLAYDVCRGMGYTSSTVEQWFLNLAELAEDAVRRNMSGFFPNRSTNSYVSRSSFVDTDVNYGYSRRSDGSIIYYPRILRVMNNRRSNQAGLFGMAGVMFNNTYYKNEFKRYMREWLMFGHRTTTLDGANGEPDRGSDSFPQRGINYSFHSLETLAHGMDGLARQGDTSVYDFSSSDGSKHPTWGTAHFKTMEDVLGNHIKWITNSFPAQYTGSGDPPPTSIVGDPKFRIQTRGYDGTTNREICNDGHLLLAANYYNRPDWQAAILRQGTPTGFTSIPQGSGSIGGWRADWRQRFLRDISTNPYGGGS
jgi:hypothetical protein